MNEIQFLMYDSDEKMVISILENTIKHDAIDVFHTAMLKKR